MIAALGALCSGEPVTAAHRAPEGGLGEPGFEPFLSGLGDPPSEAVDASASGSPPAELMLQVLGLPAVLPGWWVHLPVGTVGATPVTGGIDPLNASDPLGVALPSPDTPFTLPTVTGHVAPTPTTARSEGVEVPDRLPESLPAPVLPTAPSTHHQPSEVFERLDPIPPDHEPSHPSLSSEGSEPEGPKATFPIVLPLQEARVEASPPAVADAASSPSPLLHQVAEHLELVVRSPDHEGVRLHLHPPELGYLEIAVQVRGSEVHAQVTAQHEHTRHLLEASVNQLRQMLAERGLHLGAFQVNVGGSFPHPHGAFTAPERAAGTGRSAPRPQPEEPLDPLTRWSVRV